MKKYLFLIVMVAFAAGAYAQQASTKKVSGPVITFEKKTHDFGEIVQGDKVEETFKFTNTGTEPLILTNVQVTCGCTTPKGWPRDPIQPGGKGEIVVAFNSAGKIGRQDKVVTVVSNAANPDEAKISFTAQVSEKKQPQ
ncbi:DUF1573 domain-containing protein [Fulvivirgaceae bacterium PWU5]|jgi:hypothetical protein|uniref:DUF1573 domain-containing protein n=1 Tax=Dawidia cretensis TaxID=2782350 RepID=A0AAP2E417_9BACT|nr:MULTISPECIES: DUF1573 domain-containing protein [Cytophagales]MBT1711738.1 DUF1573 domain-containing protein [Dawidia cretensis]MCD9019049.1 DUF1573 domain-containing protein [Parachryseolinea silvisoli]